MWVGVGLCTRRSCPGVRLSSEGRLSVFVRVSSRSGPCVSRYVCTTGTGPLSVRGEWGRRPRATKGVFVHLSVPVLPLFTLWCLYDREVYRRTKSLRTTGRVGSVERRVTSISVSVHVYTAPYVSMCVHECVREGLCVSTSKSVPVCSCVSTRTSVCRRVSVCVHRCPRVSIGVHMCLCVSMCTSTCL